MTGPLAQIVALTCYGNAFLGGITTSKFFPENSTCQFCDSVKFVELKKSLSGTAEEVVIAVSPDEWIAGLKKRKATGIRLTRTPQNDPKISDRMSAGFVGGGGTWVMEVLRSNGQSEIWSSRWEVWNQKAVDRRIWRVTYGLIGNGPTQAIKKRDLAKVKTDFKTSLQSIHAFSTRKDCGGFTKCFANALQALDDSTVDIGYHKDLYVPGQLTPDAIALLKASMSAWVFGGMGSWNDLGFDGADQHEYEQVSDRLFGILNEAVEVAASSSIPKTGDH